MDARLNIERMLADYIPPVHRPHTIRFQLDQRVTGRATLARILWLQGFPDQAMCTARTNVEHAREIDQGLSLCNALSDAACPIALFVGDLAAAEHWIAMLLDHSGKHALGAWHALGRVFEAVLLIRRGMSLRDCRFSVPPLTGFARPGSFTDTSDLSAHLLRLSALLGTPPRESRRLTRRLPGPSAPKHAGAWPSCCGSKASLFCWRVQRIARIKRGITF
jgi:hypothetical protein